VGNFPVEKMKTQHHREDGKALADHMQQCGVNARKLEHCGVLIPVEQIAAFIELHIEQGPMLHQRQVPVGVVISNRGSVRVPKVKIMGEGGHTGTVPMEQRKDAVRAAARFITRFEDECNALLKAGHDLVYTVPVIEMGAGASPTTIPAECSFYLEARSDSMQTQSQLLELIGKLQYSIEKDYNVTIALDHPTVSKPAMMDEALQQQLQDAAHKQQIKTCAIASGAGHDAAIFANAGIKAGMLFIRHEGNSHRADEGMTLDDLALSVQVLAQLCMDGVKGAHTPDKSFTDILCARDAEPIMMQDYATDIAHG
jgi:beta-ureidopropionase / N-carbamoyl-L-amino-acid hydrolase